MKHEKLNIANEHFFDTTGGGCEAGPVEPLRRRNGSGHRQAGLEEAAADDQKSGICGAESQAKTRPNRVSGAAGVVIFCFDAGSLDSFDLCNPQRMKKETSSLFGIYGCWIFFRLPRVCYLGWMWGGRTWQVLSCPMGALVWNTHRGGLVPRVQSERIDRPWVILKLFVMRR